MGAGILECSIYDGLIFLSQQQFDITFLQFKCQVQKVAIQCAIHEQQNCQRSRKRNLPETTRRVAWLRPRSTGVIMNVQASLSGRWLFSTWLLSKELIIN